MLTSLVSLQQGKIKKSEKPMNIEGMNPSILKEKILYLLNDLSNFNKIFRKSVAYDNIKIHKIPGFHSFPRKHIFAKNHRGGG